ncbi:hypothetical protein BJY01DRAFT_245353 [Aspergillus pseudoustus]|uniref:Transcription factor domain-containing protein n=1 Tax=Aspergillus pseudoustus TaxID=1810923 RepID=A0ABR4KEF8_9EURO
MYHDADGDLCDRLYTAHLRVHLLDLLPENMKELVILAEDVSSPVHDAFLALSSANLSYLESKHEGTILEYPATLEVVRNPLHTLRAAAYFQRASKKIRLDEYTDLESLAATIGLLGYYELELGSVQSFQWHLCAFNDIIRQHEETFSCSPIGTASLQMWITLYVRSLTFVFPTRLYPEDPDAALLHKIAYKHATPYQALSMVVADAANVSHRLLLVSCMRLGFEDTRTVLQKVVTWYSTMRSPLSMEPCRPVQDPLGDDQICLVLSELRSCLAKLNINTTILSSLPKLGPASSSSEGHPAEVETTHSEDIPIKSLGITPLTFHTHDETMLHALHATAQLACEESHIEYMRSKKRSYTPPLSPWLRLLLCIAEGIITAPQTASACLLKNVYAPQGIASLVLQAALKCPWHIGALTYLSQRFFPQLQAASGNPSGGPPPATREESNIPLALYARIMRYLRFEALRGREVFIVAFDQDQTVDTGSTFALLHRPLVLTVHGRSAGPNGGFFNDCVRVGVVDS